MKEKELPPIPFPDLKAESSSAGGGEESVKVEGEVDGQENEKDEEEVKVEKEKEEPKLVSVSHVLTNVMVLQEFLLELAALVQVRAGLFREVKYV